MRQSMVWGWDALLLVVWEWDALLLVVWEWDSLVTNSFYAWGKLVFTILIKWLIQRANSLITPPHTHTHKHQQPHERMIALPMVAKSITEFQSDNWRQSEPDRLYFHVCLWRLAKGLLRYTLIECVCTKTAQFLPKSCSNKQTWINFSSIRLCTYTGDS